MPPLEVRFDLLTLLQDITQLSPDQLGIDRLLIIAEKDGEDKTVETHIALAGQGTLDVSSMIHRALEKEPQLALSFTLAAAAYMAAQKKKP